jgi:hypothetical protein
MPPTPRPHDCDGATDPFLSCWTLPATTRRAASGRRGRSAQAGKAKALILIGAGLLGGGLLLFVVSQIDQSQANQGQGGGAGSSTSPRIGDAKDLLEPAPLSARERESGKGDLSLAQLERGAWVQVADESGRLAQQYSAQSVKPLPERELELTLPKAIFYQPDGRVIQLTADHGRARVPNQALERGTLTGHVTIRVFRPVTEGVPVDVQNDKAIIEIDADDAHFDNIEIRCDGRIDLRSEMGNFHGRGLSMILEPKSGQIESLFIEKCTEPIVFVRGADKRMRPEGARPSNASTGDRTKRPDPVVADAAGHASSPPPPPVPAPPADDKGRAKERAKGATRAQEETQFFQLVLQQNVLVTRRKAGRATTLRGDLLNAVFAMESSSAFGTIAEVPLDELPMGMPLTPMGFIHGSVFAATPIAFQNAADQETITITYDGPLELRPAGERLATADDIRIELESTGNDQANRVIVDDERSRAHVTCRLVRFTSDGDRIDAEGTADHPLEFSSPRLKARGERFWLEQAKGRGKFEGPGTVRLASGGEFFVPMALEPSTAGVASQPNGSLVASAQAPTTEPSSVELAWSKELDLTFANAQDPADSAAAATGEIGAGELRGAHFRGEVVATGDSFRLDANDLDVTFGATAEEGGSEHPSTLQRILATGSDGTPATARRTDGKGTLKARTLDLTLRPDLKRGAAPAQLLAQGAVEATDPQQTLWTTSLSVTFLPSSADPAVATVPDRLGEEIAKVEGRGGIQARLAGATMAGDETATSRMPIRVFADELDGDGLARTLDVTGDDVWIVRDTVVADGFKSIHFDEATRVATSPDAGRVRVFATSIGQGLETSPSGVSRVKRPELPEQTALKAEWNKGFRFDERAAEGGAIDLDGSVRVRSTPDRASTDAVDAEWLRIELDRAQAAGDSATSGSASSGVRRVKAKSAVGLANTASSGATASAAGASESPMANVESRRWTSEARQGDPRILRLSGDSIEFDALTHEGTVASRGKLFIHVPDQTTDATAPAGERPLESGESTVQGRPLGVGVVGSTLFTWERELRWTRRPDAETDKAEFTVTMEDAVRVSHADTSQLVLTAARLEADFERLSEQRTAADGGLSPGTNTASPGVGLTGTGKLLRVRAFGPAIAGQAAGAERITIETDDFTIKCDRFAYDATTNVATLTAAEGSTVDVVPAKDPSRRSASSVEWNMATGTLRIRDAR